MGEPPDPRKVRVYGPGVEDGLVQTFESKFLVETVGAGAGQLAVRIRGPRGSCNAIMISLIFLGLHFRGRENYPHHQKKKIKKKIIDPAKDSDFTIYVTTVAVARYLSW